MSVTSGGSAWSALTVLSVGTDGRGGGVMTVDTVGVFLVFDVDPAVPSFGSVRRPRRAWVGLAYRTKQKGRGTRLLGFRGPGGTARD
ncbi:hypothetical protein Kpho02_13490 [Kitasatospora phosalacinea]|uniref:Uncharacterized protein n=1 Tax=Kitasatospora phosalacinea TaxID=2065 RepID=A0A9W6V1L5_9ACTN|nr:hypothetical protein Kpho02_13490 [Kitasatospora phosalacinea]